MIINLNDVKNILESEFFLSKWDKAFHFLQAELYDWALVSNMQIETRKIVNWEEFEYGRIDFDENYFQSLIFEKEHSLNTEVLFISDESLLKKTALSFKIGDFEKFINYYEDVFKMGLFQPEDYIVYLRDYKLLRIIHHEGTLIRISRMNPNSYDNVRLQNVK
jgi:hypothetical protein